MDEPAFFVCGNKTEYQKAAIALGELSEENHIVHHTSAYYRDFRDTDTNVSVRSPFARGDFEYFRGNEALPRNQKDLMAWCMNAYKENGLIKNIVDLMADFVTQGVRLVHPNKANQKFYDWWWERVRGKDRTERMANMFYRTGTVVVRRKTGRVKSLRRKFTIASPDEEITVDNLPEVERGEIPTGYIIYNPQSLEVVGEKLASFVGKISYAIRIPKDLSRLVEKIKQSGSQVERELLKSLPENIRKSLNTQGGLILLDPNKTEALYYKKDDWELWGTPMIMAIIKDIILLEKMKLADMTALDGIISSVRLWRLGSLDHKIMPAPGAIRKLTNILMKNTAGGSYDLIWGPDLDFKESNSNAYQALGKEKYEPTLNAIYAGLGIPPTLTGGATQTGFTNNFVSLKTLTERLNYCRDALVEFWNKEIKIVQKSLGLRIPATVTFDHMSLSDESAEKALLLQMWDRNIISNEAINERFKEDPEIERIRINQETRMRKSGKMAPKAGPWFVAEKEHEYKKLFTQLGELSPEQLDLDIPPSEDTPNKRKERIQVELNKVKQQQQKQRGQPQQGRPVNSKDSKKRKQKTVKPRQQTPSFGVVTWALQAYRELEEIINPIVLGALKKSRVAALTNKEIKDVNKLKLSTLLQLQPYSQISKGEIRKIVQSGPKLDKVASSIYTEVKTELANSLNRKLTAEDLRQVCSYTYFIYHEV